MIPSFFISHGGPSLVMEENEYTDFLKEIGTNIEKPKAIVIFSAHYEGTKVKIGAVSDIYDLIYDFYNLNEELYYVHYAAKGDKKLAERIKNIFFQHGIEAALDKERGLDHGVWSILKLMYPEGDIPVVPISLNPFISPAEYYRIGEVLSPLREEDILIIGSGGIVHNMDTASFEGEETLKYETAFDDWLREKLLGWDLEKIFNYAKVAPNANKAVPRPEHLAPLIIMMGTAASSKKVSLVKKVNNSEIIGLSCYKFE